MGRTSVVQAAGIRFSVVDVGGRRAQEGRPCSLSRALQAGLTRSLVSDVLRQGPGSTAVSWPDPWKYDGWNFVPELYGGLLFSLLGEKTLENFGALFFVAFRSGPKKCLADLRHAAAFASRDAFQFLLKIARHSERELSVFLHGYPPSKSRRRVSLIRL